MNNNISFFNFYWEDLTNPPFEKILNATQVVDFIIRHKKGKVLIHCHAGMGRTALLVGTYLLYAGIAQDDKDAIKITKAQREKCFGKSYNVNYMKSFYEYLMSLRHIFPQHHQIHHHHHAASKKLKHEELTFRQIMKNQNLLLHGEERRFIKFVPKVLHKTLEKIKELEEKD